MRRTYLYLFLAGLLFNIGVAWFQSSPGYMDADYYFAGGLQLANGRGFTEPYLWNYLDDPIGLPHPSHTYWMPLASLLAAAGLWIAPQFGFASARVGFILAAACVPPITAALSFSVTSNRALSLAAGLLAAFSGFYAAFLPVTDTFGLYMLGGGAFFLLARRFRENKTPWLALPLGLIAGLMHLARADGLMWLGMFFLVIGWVYWSEKHRMITPLMLGIFAYFVVMSPWYIRNLMKFGTFMSPGSGRALWLTEYNRLFAFPSSQLSFDAWWSVGWQSALDARLWALGVNLQSLVGVQMSVFLLPFVLVALWQLRSDFSVRLSVFGWALTFLAMSIIFPYAGARGGFFHSGAAFQPMWWILAPVGLDRVTAWAAERIPTWTVERAQGGFRILLIGLAGLLTLGLVVSRVVLADWDVASRVYTNVEAQISLLDPEKDVPVIVANPPGYYIYSGRPAIALPDGDLGTLFALRDRFGARYVIMDENSTPDGLAVFFEAADAVEGLIYLGEVDGTRIFEIP